MKRLLPFLLIALVAAATLGAGTWLLRTKQVQAAKVAAEAPAVVETAGAPGAKQPPVRGAPKAAVTVEEFADFQCPPCAAVSTALHKVEEEYRGKLRVIFRHYPLQIHQHARPAALAAEAAALQGKFWEMHDLLYKNQTVWTKAADVRPLFAGYAATLGLDAEKFAADQGNQERAVRIKADQDRAASLGVQQTPTVFLNGERLPVTSLSLDGLRARIDGALGGPANP